MSEQPTEREWLEGLRYEDKFPEPPAAACPDCGGLGYIPKMQATDDDANSVKNVPCPNPVHSQPPAPVPSQRQTNLHADDPEAAEVLDEALASQREPEQRWKLVFHDDETGETSLHGPDHPPEADFLMLAPLAALQAEQERADKALRQAGDFAVRGDKAEASLQALLEAVAEHRGKLRQESQEGLGTEAYIDVSDEANAALYAAADQARAPQESKDR